MNDPLFSFGIVSDVQYANIESTKPETRPAKLGIEKLSKAVEVFNNKKLDFVVNLGDLIDRDPNNFPAILEVFSKCNHPIWHVLGNHDFCGPDYDYGHKSEAFSALGFTDRGYYYKDLNNYRFIILDTNEIGLIEHPENSPQWLEDKLLIEDLEANGAHNALPWNGAVSSQQLKWLDETIDSASSLGLNCILFAHHPVYPEHRDSCLNSAEIIKLISTKSNVKAYINGHNHDGDYGELDGIAFWTIEGMMDYKDKTAFAIANVYEDKIEVQGFGRTEDRVIKIS